MEAKNAQDARRRAVRLAQSEDSAMRSSSATATSTGVAVVSASSAGLPLLQEWEPKAWALRTDATYMKLSPTFRHTDGALTWAGSARSRSLTTAAKNYATAVAPSRSSARSTSASATAVVNKASMVAAGVTEAAIRATHAARGYRGSDDFRATEAGRRQLAMMSGHQAMAAQRGGHV